MKFPRTTIRFRFAAAAALFLALSSGALRAEEAATTEDEGGLFGWVGTMRASMLAKQYDISDTAAMTLMDILRDETAEKKKINAEISDLGGQLEPLVAEGSETGIAAIFEKIKERRLALAANENRTTDRVVELIGPQKAAKWMLSRRGMMQRLGSSVRRVGQSVGNDATDTSRPARTSGYGRSGPGGYR